MPLPATTLWDGCASHSLPSCLPVPAWVTVWDRGGSAAAAPAPPTPAACWPAACPPHPAAACAPHPWILRRGCISTQLTLPLWDTGLCAAQEHAHATWEWDWVWMVYLPVPADSLAALRQRMACTAAQTTCLLLTQCSIGLIIPTLAPWHVCLPWDAATACRPPACVLLPSHSITSI